LISRRKNHNLRRWLRHDETLSAIEEEMVYMCVQRLEGTSVVRKIDQINIS